MHAAMAGCCAIWQGNQLFVYVHLFGQAGGIGWNKHFCNGLLLMIPARKRTMTAR